MMHAVVLHAVVLRAVPRVSVALAQFHLPLGGTSVLALTIAALFLIASIDSYRTARAHASTGWSVTCMVIAWLMMLGAAGSVLLACLV